MHSQEGDVIYTVETMRLKFPPDESTHVRGKYFRRATVTKAGTHRPTTLRAMKGDFK